MRTLNHQYSAKRPKSPVKIPKSSPEPLDNILDERYHKIINMLDQLTDNINTHINENC